MVAKLHPIASEFATQEDADRYDIWFRAKVETSLLQADDPSTPRHTADAVAQRLDAVIKAAQVKHAQCRLA
jgi:hypothetical protein